MQWRPLAARALLLTIGVLLFVVVGELALRIVYWDGGARTLGGPGGKPFDHRTIDGVNRGRRELGPKDPGVPRVMIVGDSITYGLGVRDWQATWPEQLAAMLQHAGRPHQFAVFALPGNDMPQHLETMRGVSGLVQPDVLIYQWYVNDIEAISHRPDLQRLWQRLPWHDVLRSWSYLYFVLDQRLAQVLSRPHRVYAGYLTNEFRPGSLEWTEFEREFHEFATLAMTAPKRIMMLYPQVPFRGAYPLQVVHDRMRELAGPHTLAIPPIAWTRSGGVLVSAPEAPHAQAVKPLSATGTFSVQTKDYLFRPGHVTLKFAVTNAPRGDLGVVELVDPARNQVMAAAVLHCTEQDCAAIVTQFTLPGDRVRRLAVRVTSFRHVAWALSNISIPVDYGFTVLDLTQTLNTFNTHASAFDAHPNERTHAVIADTVYAAMNAPR